ncbi:ATP-dependent DNA ligase [Niallia sp. 03133]|uniref:ATP-dependent DNA ligase n=1 Tax=Niallia sp. 03133 TaxID=3458060 RepID=UPI004043A459
MQPITPFEPIGTDIIPVGDNWIGQVKWDGTRILTYSSVKSVRLFNRKLNERTKQYPELLIPSKYTQAKSIILDGEIIALKEGKPSFYEVMKRDKIKNIEKNERIIQNIPITYMVFDILYLDGKWLTKYPLVERQRFLKEIMIPNEHIQIVESFTDKEGLFQACMKSDLEGVVFKDLNSTYLIKGKDSRWQKKKKQHDLVAVVGGVSYKNSMVNSLNLGLFNEIGHLVYIGSVGTGKLTRKDWMDLTTAIKPLITEKTPFINFIDKGNIVWLNPMLTVKVTFLEWIEGQILRHPVIEAFVSVSPSDCKIDFI